MDNFWEKIFCREKKIQNFDFLDVCTYHLNRFVWDRYTRPKSDDRKYLTIGPKIQTTWCLNNYLPHIPFIIEVTVILYLALLVLWSFFTFFRPLVFSFLLFGPLDLVYGPSLFDTDKSRFLSVFNHSCF